MSLYAWNSAPVIGTDISRSLLVVGREFQFPIDFSADQHQMLTSSPARVSSFARDQARLLQCGREIATEIIHTHRAMHREFINRNRPDPRQYSVGDKVFAKRAVKSIKKRGLVGKIMDAYTGPWLITAKGKGSSYDLEHLDTKKIGKRHAALLSPYPDELLPFLPIDGPDNQYGQLHVPIQKDPYMNAGIKGFQPPQPHKSTSLPVLSDSGSEDIKFPTLAELNAELFDWEDGEEETMLANEPLCADIEVFATTRSQSAAAKRKPLPPIDPPDAPKVPEIGPLTASILQSDDKLFFVSHRIPGSSSAEWALVRVDLPRTMQAHPQALQDGRFLVEFYTCHPKDKRFNAINQRYWLEYHPVLEVAYPGRDKCTHMIRPAPESVEYAKAQGLKPFSQWVRLTNADTYICGPFEFATINGRRTRDRVSGEHWKLLREFGHLFTNETPCLDLPDYSIHCGQYHSTFECDRIHARVLAHLAHPSSPDSV